MRISIVLSAASVLVGCPERKADTGPAPPASASAAPVSSGPMKSEVVKCMAQAKGKPLAEKQFPGRAMADLARVVVLNCHTGGAPGCHPVSHSSLGIRDGVVSAWCEPDEVPSLTFVSPF